MAYQIRRNSMEHLELYDLDKLTSNHQLPPPLPAPRKHRRHLPPQFSFERYQFLCDMTRHKTDPIYAATPMFTTLPQSLHVKHRRQVLGSHVPLKIITPRLTASVKSSEVESAEARDDMKDEEKEEQEQESSEEDDQDSDNDDNDDDDDGDQSSSSSSSSSSSDDNDDNDILNDNDDNKGVVEQIFNRHKK